MGRTLSRIFAVVAFWAGVNAFGAYAFRRSRRAAAGSRRHFLVTQGGLEIEAEGEEVQDAVVSVMMGGAVLDLREAVPPVPPVRLDVMVIMGGVQLIVPEEWKVQVDVKPMMGGVQDGRHGTRDRDRPVDLVLTGRVALGGLELVSRGRRDRKPVRLAAGSEGKE
jgi:hypothetical protein